MFSELGLGAWVATPSMRDIVFHTQWCACLAMVAVEWPTFVCESPGRLCVKRDN